MKKKTIVIISVLLVILMIIAIWCITVECLYNPNLYSEEKHFANVSKIAEKNYKVKPDINPLYDNNDKLIGFLINSTAYEEYSIVLVQNPHFLFKLFGPVSMYQKASIDTYQRYKIRNNEKEVVENGIKWKISNDEKKAKEYPNRLWKTDANGEEIVYTKSFYQVANVMDEKKYLLQIEQANEKYYIPAVKRGEKYLNLVSMEEFKYQQNYITEEQPCLELVCFAKDYFK